MLFDLVWLVVGVLGLVVLWWSMKALLAWSWIIGWLRANAGFLLLLISVWLGGMAWDIFTYKPMTANLSVATFSFSLEEKGRYRVEMVDSKGNNKVFSLYGDQWQVNARVLKWNTEADNLLLKPVYRLNQLKGRYFSLAEEQKARNTDHYLTPSYSAWIDVWHWLNQHQRWVPWLKAIYASPAYMPMVDGALYDLRLHADGILIKPLNDAAEAGMLQSGTNP